MKKIYLLFALLFGLTTLVQTQDILVVESSINGETLGAINIQIEGDTTTDGARNNPDRIYQLKAGEVYIVNGPLTQTDDYHLKLIGEEPTEVIRPAVLMFGIRGDASIAGSLMTLNNDFTLKNIYVMATSSDLQPSGENMIDIYGDSINAVIENCIIEQNKGICFGFHGDYPNVTAQNNIIRNSQGNSHWNGGRFIWTWDNPCGNIEFVNNTWVNNMAYFFTERDRGTESLKIEHNTFVNSGGFVFFLHKLTNASISNNLFYNCQFSGEIVDEYTQGWNDNDGQDASIISIDTIYGNLGAFALDSTWGTTDREAERVIKVNNNAYYVDPQIVTAWETAIAEGNLGVGTQWMNTRTQAMFNDDATWPGMEESSNILDADPGFTVNPTVLDSIVLWPSILYTWALPSPWVWPVDDKPAYVPDWPIPEDLSYTNASMINGGSDGYAIGDLNWFPDQLSQFSDVESYIVAEEFTLSQNYPNPFNQETVIKYSVSKTTLVNISVYNMVGQKISELVNKEVNPGEHQVAFDASNLSSGLYFYTIEANNFIASKKMMLIK